MSFADNGVKSEAKTGPARKKDKMTGGVDSVNFIFRGSVYTPEMPKKLPLEYKSRQKYADNPRDTGS